MNIPDRSCVSPERATATEVLLSDVETHVAEPEPEGQSREALVAMTALAMLVICTAVALVAGVLGWVR